MWRVSRQRSHSHHPSDSIPCTNLWVHCVTAHYLWFMGWRCNKRHNSTLLIMHRLIVSAPHQTDPVLIIRELHILTAAILWFSLVRDKYHEYICLKLHRLLTSNTIIIILVLIFFMFWFWRRYCKISRLLFENNYVHNTNWHDGRRNFICNKLYVCLSCHNRQSKY